MYLTLFLPLQAETRAIFYFPPTTLSSSLAEVRFASLVVFLLLYNDYLQIFYADERFLLALWTIQKIVFQNGIFPNSITSFVPA